VNDEVACKLGLLVEELEQGEEAGAERVEPAVGCVERSGCLVGSEGKGRLEGLELDGLNVLAVGVLAVGRERGASSSSGQLPCVDGTAEVFGCRDEGAGALQGRFRRIGWDRREG